MDCDAQNEIQENLHPRISALERVFSASLRNVQFALRAVRIGSQLKNVGQQNATKLVHRKPQPLAVAEAGEVTISEPVRLDILEPGKPSQLQP